MATELATWLDVSEEDRLEQAEALVRSYCGWHIAPPRASQVFLQKTASGVILLPSLYVTAIVSVADAETTFTASDYIFTTDGQVYRPGLWWEAGTTVTFTHGYTNAPPEVTAIVQAVAQRSLDNPGGVSSQGAGPFSVAYSSSAQSGTAVSLLEAEKAVLRLYRVPVAP